jgi:hypothetical protein
MLDDTAFRSCSRAVSTQGDENVTLSLVQETPESRSSTGGERRPVRTLNCVIAWASRGCAKP